MFQIDPPSRLEALIPLHDLFVLTKLTELVAHANQLKHHRKFTFQLLEKVPIKAGSLYRKITYKACGNRVPNQCQWFLKSGSSLLQIWIVSVSQSLYFAMGMRTTLGSYNKYNNNCYRWDCLGSII